VSFMLAFFNAARAYELPMTDQIELGRRLLHRIAHRPLEFILPSRTPFKLSADHVHA
jgi:site-specific recombinase